MIALMAAWLASDGRAHADGSGVPRSSVAGWEADPWIVVMLFVTVAVYVTGLRMLRRATGRPRKLRREAWLFGAGWMALVIALVSPVHALSREYFSVHMSQHEILMVVAAPLLVLGRPAIAMAWAFPRAALRRMLAALRRAGAGTVWRVVTSLAGATLLQAAALWIWHVPAFFDATLTDDGVHAWQHISFTATAGFFWHAVFYGRDRAAGYGMAVLMLFLTAGHSGALGALLTLASQVWYAGYATPVASHALSPLEDQQLGGLIMWVPAGLVYVVAGLALFAGWLRESERRRNRRPAAPTALRPRLECTP